MLKRGGTEMAARKLIVSSMGDLYSVWPKDYRKYLEQIAAGNGFVDIGDYGNWIRTIRKNITDITEGEAASELEYLGS